MRGVWFWIGMATAGSVLIASLIKAFRNPWVWSSDQLLVVFLVCMIPIGFVKWGGIWQREGFSGVKTRWKTLWSDAEKAQSDRPSQVIIWIVIALVLVAVLTMSQNH